MLSLVASGDMITLKTQLHKTVLLIVSRIVWSDRITRRDPYRLDSRVFAWIFVSRRQLKIINISKLVLSSWVALCDEVTLKTEHNWRQPVVTWFFAVSSTILLSCVGWCVHSYDSSQLDGRNNKNFLNFQKLDKTVFVELGWVFWTSSLSINVMMMMLLGDNNVQNLLSPILCSCCSICVTAEVTPDT